MPRRRVAAKREIIPDPKFGSVRLARFMNVLMECGKKSIAEKIVYGALESALGTIMSQRSSEKADKAGETDGEGSITGSTHEERALNLFDRILENLRPTVEVRSRRVGGATYQIPVEVRQARGIALAMRWVVQSARNRGEKGMMRRLAAEFVDVYYKRGNAMKKREDTHKMARANQAFAHFRWN